MVDPTSTNPADEAHDIYSILSMTEAAFHEYEVDKPCDLQQSGQRIACCFPVNEALAQSVEAFRNPETTVKIGAYLSRLESLKKRVYAKKMSLKI